MKDVVVKGFGSDNHCGVHPQILEALQEANRGHAPSYGTDSITLAAEKKISELFSTNLACFFVFNGTAANTLALQSLCTSYGAVLCTDISHVYNDECGAPERVGGVKLLPQPSENGKFIVEALAETLARQGDQHSSQVQAITITQPTELGTVYSLSELRELIQFAKSNHLKVHIDGARLNNAVCTLKCTHAEMAQGADAISFGGTKNGFMFGEAVLFTDKNKSSSFKYIRKQGLNLPSKSRFIGAQFNRYLKGDLWSEIAEHENHMARILSEKIKTLSFSELIYPTESNAVFARIPAAIANRVRKDMFFYYWDRSKEIVRLMSSFDTTSADIDRFTQLLERTHHEVC